VISVFTSLIQLLPVAWFNSADAITNIELAGESKTHSF